MKAAARTRAVEQFYDNRLFDGVDPNVIKCIAPNICVLRNKRGVIFFREGEPSDSLYPVGRGCVKIAKAADGIVAEKGTTVDIRLPKPAGE